ncbi:hypothetical protein SK128_005405 [Halocaridina rubra]|uniref:Uncharacterized protein n=1 Tax=Halocaridina rubra TaxID=373956 RepID=A0AAN8XD92_HALRR
MAILTPTFSNEPAAMGLTVGVCSWCDRTELHSTSASSFVMCVVVCLDRSDITDIQLVVCLDRSDITGIQLVVCLDRSNITNIQVVVCLDRSDIAGIQVVVCLDRSDITDI